MSTNIAELLRDESTWRDGWQTRDGRPVRIIMWDNGHPTHPVIARTGREEGEVFCCRADGTWGGGSNPLDLIPRPKKHKVWVNVYHDSSHLPFYFGYAFPNKERAVGAACPGRIACIEVEFTEGEGL